MTTKRPLSVKPLAARQPVEWNVFNTTHFETYTSANTFGYLAGKEDPDLSVRLPGSGAPTYWDILADTNLTLRTQPMVGLAIGAKTLPLEEYLDWQKLSTAYADGYRLLFSRAMVDVLGNGSQETKEVQGQHSITTEAVILEPIFVHIVAALLGIVSAAAIALLVLSYVRERSLQFDPSTIASIMALVADNQLLLSDLANLDCCSPEDVQDTIGQKRYKLVNDGSGARYVMTQRSRTQ